MQKVNFIWFSVYLAVLDEFEVEDRQKRRIKFYNQNNDVIPSEHLGLIIKQYKSCAYFKLQLVFVDSKEQYDANIEVSFEYFQKSVSIITIILSVYSV